MKTFFVIFSLVIFPVLSIQADEPSPKPNFTTQNKTPRMSAIELKYHLLMLFTIGEANKPKTWVFLCRSERIEKGFPVAMPAKATDHDAEIAIRAAYNCAAFYQEMESQEKAKTKESATLYQ